MGTGSYSWYIIQTLLFCVVVSLKMYFIVLPYDDVCSRFSLDEHVYNTPSSAKCFGEYFSGERQGKS